MHPLGLKPTTSTTTLLLQWEKEPFDLEFNLNQNRNQYIKYINS